MLSVIQLLHDSMQAKVRAEGEQTDTIKVNKGLHQGCTLAPVLFNIYYSAVVAQWRSSCPCARHRSGQKLVGDRTAMFRLLHSVITETQFADDAAIFTSREGCEEPAGTFIRCAACWGLTVSIKTQGNGG